MIGIQASISSSPSRKDWAHVSVLAPSYPDLDPFLYSGFLKCLLSYLFNSKLDIKIPRMYWVTLYTFSRKVAKGVFHTNPDPNPNPRYCVVLRVSSWLKLLILCALHISKVPIHAQNHSASPLHAMTSTAQRTSVRS